MSNKRGLRFSSKAVHLLATLVLMPCLVHAQSGSDFSTRIPQIEATRLSLRAELRERLEGISSEDQKSELKNQFTERIYELFVSITEFFPLSRSATPSLIFGEVRDYDRKNSKDLRELSSVVVCPVDNINGCANITAFGDKGSIPREISEPSGYFLLKSFSDYDSKIMMIDSHHHPVEFVRTLYQRGNEQKNPVITIDRPDTLLSGPSSWDCLNFQAKNQRRYKNLISAAVVVDRGGIWFCKADWPRDLLDSSKAEKHLALRAKLIKDSQTLSGASLKAAVQKFSIELKRIYRSQNLEIQFLEHGSSDAEILQVIQRLDSK